MPKPTLQEREDIQAVLEAARDEALATYKNYRTAYQDQPTAGVNFAKEVVQCEMLMSFNAAAIKAEKTKSARTPASKKRGPAASGGPV